uniref:Uncharacterized protein n=1 Tax=Panagrellus redivivus TaxID=6233 RepID=A0A7E4V8K3_PANRE
MVEVYVIGGYILAPKIPCDSCCVPRKILEARLKLIAASQRNIITKGYDEQKARSVGKAPDRGNDSINVCANDAMGNRIMKYEKLVEIIEARLWIPYNL